MITFPFLSMFLPTIPVPSSIPFSSCTETEPGESTPCSLAGTSMRNPSSEGFQEDALNLMTFHASKGLEFRRVYLIDVNEGLVPHRRAKTKEEIEEERRVLYVAMTRAKEELYLLYTEKRGGRDIPPSRFLRELI